MDFHRCRLFWCSFCLVFLLLVPDNALAAGPYLGAAYLTCMHNTTNGTSLSTTFKHNLHSALQNLTSRSSRGTKYATTTVGSSDDMVYAMFQCRGDQTTQLCWECLANATVRLPVHDCPASIGARIQLDGCYLRYDNKSFFTLDVSYAVEYCYAKTSDATVLSTISSLVENVTTEAPKQHGFASASADGEYAAAQCLGYLNETECSECLSTVPYRTVCDSTLGEQVHLTSCYYRFESYSFSESVSTVAPRSVPPGLPTSAPSPGNKSQKGHKIAVVGAGISIGAVVALVVLCAILVRRYNQGNKMTGKKQLESDASLPETLIATKARVFSLQELEKATRFFHPDNKLGEGGYGPVYKGILSNGKPVAIKKLATTSSQGRSEFLNEVNLITGVQHKNLIRLLGSCVEYSERILVYEYIANESLDFMLFGKGGQQDGRILDWPTRYKIVLGMAKGLAYLHEESHIRIIHRDIKASNILLDNHLNAVIADFGLARLVQDDETHINTRVAGTIGYLAPEYAMCGELSEKADVFSFGMVSLEIISGRQSLNHQLLEWAWRLFIQKKIPDLIDTKLGHAFSPEQVIRIVHIALLCTQDNPKERPTMSTVVLLLSGRSEILEIPHKPTFLDLDESRMPRGATNHQWASTSSYSNTTGSQSSSIEPSQLMSNATYCISEIDPR